MINNYITASDRIHDVMAHPAFKGRGKLLFPFDEDEVYRSTMTMKDVPKMHLWHNNMDVDEMVDGVNRMIDDFNEGKQVLFEIYSDNEKAQDKSKENAGLFFLRGEPDAPFAIICPGGGFRYVGSLHEGFPVAREINKLGYNAFVLKYRAGHNARDVSQDLMRAFDFIQKNHKKLKVSPNNYSLWGGSAGARLCSYVTYNGTGLFTQEELLKPAANVIAYTYFNFKPDFTENDPPAFFITGTQDWLVPISSTAQNVEGLRKKGVNVEFLTPKGALHGFGVGNKTPARGWIKKAVKFWEVNMKGR